MKQAELDVEGCEGNDQGVDDPTRSGVRRRLGVRDHEEGKDQQRAALDLMEWDRKWIAEPDGARDEQADIEAKKGQRHIRTCRAGDHEAAETGDEKPEPGYLSPLPGRDPAEPTGEHDDQRQVSRIEEMFVIPADDELAGDRNEGCQRCDREIVGTKQQAEGEGRDQRTAWIERRQVAEARAGILRQDRRPEGDGDL